MDVPCTLPEDHLPMETDKLIDKLFEKQGEDKKKELEPVRDLLKGILQ